MEVITNGSTGAIQQVRTAQGLVNVAVADAYTYYLQVFYATNVTSKDPGTGLYGTNAAAFVTWTIQNPDGATSSNRLVITESRTSSPTRQFTYCYTNESGQAEWQLSDSGGLRTVVSWGLAGSGSPTTTNTFREIRSGSTIVSLVQNTYALLGGHWRITTKTEGANGVTNITSYTYNSSNLVERISYPDGNWQFFVYDDLGRVSTNYSAYDNSALPTAGAPLDPLTNHCRIVEYDYSPVVGEPSPQLQPTLARTEITRIPVSTSGSWAMQEVSRLYRFVPFGDEVDEQRCPNPGASRDDPANLVTKTVRYMQGTDTTNSAIANQMAWQIRPDGTADVYTYQTNAAGVVTNSIAQTGAPSDTINPTNVVDGTQTQTALDSLGRVVRSTSYAVTNGLAWVVTSDQTVSYSGDPLLRDYQIVDLANRTNQVHYACCGIDNAIDPDGVVTQFSYDTLRRQVAALTLRGGSTGVQITNVLDAAGRVLVTQRIGTDGSTITQAQNLYDALGRVTSETNALGGGTTHVEAIVNNQRCVTNTYPDGGTRIEVYYRDGRPQSVSGTAVAPVQYQYSAELDSDGVTWREYTLEIRLTSTGDTNEWIKTYTNGAGHACKTIYPLASGSYPTAVSYYNSGGQLTNQVDPDGVSTIFAYNDRGEQTLTVLDTNRDYNIDFAGSDRITFTTNDIVSDHGANVQRTRVYVWSTSADASNLVSTTETSTDGLKSWNTVWNGSTPVTSQSTMVYSSGGNRYLTNIASDNSFNVTAYAYGQVASITKYDSSGSQLGQTAYAYDTHWRQNLSTDARNGTSTNYFNNADQISGVVTPMPASGASSEITTNFFDSLGRIWKSTLPDSTSVTNGFDVTGLVTNKSGSREYPVAYTFDAQGRMKTMTTWTNYASNQGQAVTTWNYDIYRGWLTNKSYADGYGPKYTYTPAGRLKTRTWARGTLTTYLYSTLGDLSATFYSDATAGVTNGYDRRGRQLSITQGSALTSRTYDDAGDLLGEAYTGGQLNGLAVTNIYDSFLRRTTNGVLSGSSWLTQTRYAYDAASRFLSVSNSTNSAWYSYLANSPLVSQICFTNGNSQRMVTSKQYDYLNRLTSITNTPSAAGSSAIGYAYAYNAANQRAAMTNADGSHWAYTYNALGQVTSGKRYWSDGTLVAGQQFQYSFDDIGNRQSAATDGDQSGGNLRSQSYTANNLDQYTSRTFPGYVQSLGTAATNANVLLWGDTNHYVVDYRRGTYFWGELWYDNSGGPLWLNLTNYAAVPGGTNADVLASTSGHIFLPGSTEQFAYDFDGNLTQDSHWNYGWDAENRLIAMTNRATAAPAQVLHFDYDATGRRTRKQAWNNGNGSGSPTNDLRFVYDSWNLVGICNSSLAAVDSFLWGPDLSGSYQGAGGVGGLLSFSQISGASVTNTSFPCFDGNGNVAGLVNSADGTVAGQYDYGPFGEVIRATGPMANANPFQFSTKYQDDETDFLYYGFRYYNPSTGRWLSRDPIGEQGGVNLYNFCGNAPIGELDVFGLSWPPGAYGCPACVCKKVKYGSVPTTFSSYPNNPSAGTATIGLTIPYTIETVGISKYCHCKYTDNGSISGTMTFANGQKSSINQSYAGKDTPIDCSSDSDTPGFQVHYPPTGFSVTFTVNYNWTGTVTCDSDFGPTLSDSTSINGSYSSSATWRPTK